MANQQVIVSVLGDTKHFSRSMKNSSKIMLAFGAAVVAGVTMAGRAFTDFVGESISAAEDAVAVQRRFEHMAKQSGLFGVETEKVTARIEEYARAQSFATGIDDEAILAASAKVLAFRNVAKTAETLNGVFDRTIAVSMDVAAVLGGTGDGLSNIESIAPRVAKALENPVKYMSSLARIGIKVTDVEKEKIRKLQETNGIYAAQDYLLQQLEQRYGGAALAGAKASEQIKARFEDLQEQVGTALLPSIQEMADKFGEWLDGPGGQKAIDDFVGAFDRFGKWITSDDGKKAIDDLIEGFKLMLSVTGGIVDGIRIISDFLAGPDYKKLDKAGVDAWNLMNPNHSGSGWSGNLSGLNNTSGATVGGPARMAPAGITVNFNTPVDSVSAGREVQRVLNEYSRANGRR